MDFSIHVRMPSHVLGRFSNENFQPIIVEVDQTSKCC